LTRDGPTWLLYAVLACLGFMLNGLGAVLAPLQADLQVSRAQVAFYPSLFAAGLLAVGAFGGPLVARAGRPLALQAALAALMLGGSLLAVPARAITLAGAVLLGAGGALLIQLVPALLAGLHPQAVTAAVGEANAVSSTASVVAPLAVAAALASGLGWRLGYLAFPLVALAVLLLWARRTALPAPPDPRPGSPAGCGSATPMLGRWTDVLLAVSAEFCMVFWAPSALADWHGATADQAPAVAALFLVGMAGGRALAAPVTRWLPAARAVLLAGSSLATAGFAVFWAAPTLALASVGLLVAGLGVALLYPATVSRAVAAWPHAPDRAAARAALASGLAIGGAPYLLARLADATGLRPAYLLVPALLLGLTVHTATDRRPDPVRVVP
jgi:predicted MFS family arabinose efflux permease